MWEGRRLSGYGMPLSTPGVECDPQNPSLAVCSGVHLGSRKTSLSSLSAARHWRMQAPNVACDVQIEIAGKTVKVHVFPEPSSASGGGDSSGSGASGKPPASFPRYSFQVCIRACCLCP